MLKKNNVIVVANLQAFGIVCYSKYEKKILLIPKRKEETETEKEGHIFKELFNTYIDVSGFKESNQLTGLALFILEVLLFVLLFTVEEYYVNDTVAYLIFLSISMLCGITLGELLFGETHRSLMNLEYMEVEYVDKSIGEVLKKKLRKDIIMSAVIPLVMICSFIYIPFTLEHYTETLPISVSSFVLIASACFILKGICTISPLHLKIAAYRKVKKLIKKEPND